MKRVYWLLSAPYIVASLLLEMLHLQWVRKELSSCLAIIDCYHSSIPRVFIDALVVAEDHRSELYPGIDAIAIARAIWVRFKSGEIQGASTIEQQFIRVVTSRYERTIARKLREQMLALMLARHSNKQAIASSYLAIAFYGSGFVGIDGLKMLFGEDLSKATFYQALTIIAQMKYPRPEDPCQEWSNKIESRLISLTTRVNNAANDVCVASIKSPMHSL